MADATSKSTILIRDLASIDDLRLVPEIEKEVWSVDDRDSVPVLLLIAAKEAGSILIGAFEDERLIGFTFGFPGLEGGQVSIHSHMTAVLPQYRNLNLGYQLKLAQRERALAVGVHHITWTFDPLQARNAHFNFAKLGVVSDRYKIDFYGRESTSALHQNGTDRLWVTWSLDSDRVRRRLDHIETPKSSPLENIVVGCDENRPVLGDMSSARAASTVGIQVPSDILSLEEKDPNLAWQWREATRIAFTALLEAGFFVAGFVRVGTSDAGCYLLHKGDMSQAK
jgi:predicted GNAT superfamily acetyltransferase